MDKLLELLLQNEQIVLVFIITFAAIIILLTLLMVIVVAQGRRFSFGPLEISAKADSKEEKDSSPRKNYSKENRRDIELSIDGDIAVQLLSKIIQIKLGDAVAALKAESKTYPKKRKR